MEKKPVAARSRYDKLIQLGKKADLPKSPQEATLERVANPHPDTAYLVRFTLPEFSSICPVTGQPDFAHLVIDYVPDRWTVESKSLKLFLDASATTVPFRRIVPSRLRRA